MINDPLAPGNSPKDPDLKTTTEDVAGFFKWAKLEGSQYRDYSASREKSRADTRIRGQLDRQGPAEPAALTVPSATSLNADRGGVAPMQATAGPVGTHRKLATMQPVRSVLPEPRRMALRTATRPPRQTESSRWVALKGTFDPALHHGEDEDLPAHGERLPTLAFFSLAGGTGKTSMAACIGCALAAQGLRCLLVDTHVYGLMPLYFGARELSPGASRTFASTGSAAVKVMTLDLTACTRNQTSMGGQSSLKQIMHHADDVDRILVDVSTASLDLLAQMLPLSPTVIVALVPDMASVVSLQTLQQKFEDLESESGLPIEVFYVLSQFEPSLRLHRDVRERLIRQLGKRLLPFAIRRSNAVSEALAEGMTVIDYAPEAQTAEDLRALAQWFRDMETDEIEAHDVRWGER